MNQKTELQASDLRVFPSLRMHDHADGGGAMAGTPLTGAAGEIFPPASDVDRVKGAFDVRLLYFAILKAGSASLYGAHALIGDSGQTPHLSYLLFPASKYGEQRHEIMQRIEAYSVGSGETPYTLLSKQTRNSRIVQAYKRLEDPLPQVGDVYCLRQDKRGYEKAEQYIQVVKVSSLNRTFRVRGRDFTCTVMQIEISTPLVHDFEGALTPDDEYLDNPCKVLYTAVADGAHYYGSKRLSQDARSGDLKIQVPSIFEKLVPTSQVETPLLDLNAAGLRQAIFDSGREENGLQRLQVDLSRIDTVCHLGMSCSRGTLSIDSTPPTRDEAGTLKQGAETVGSIDYARGELRFLKALGYGRMLQFQPAVAVQRVADSAGISVSLNNRGYHYLINLLPAPAAGTLQVSYRAQGKWYDLRDGGDGVLRGSAASHGSGSVNFVSGTVNISTGALPDVGSEILLTWGNAAGVHNRSDSVPEAKIVLQLAQSQIAPNSVRLSWDGHRSASDDGTGRITGDWNGRLDYRTGKIEIEVGDGFYSAGDSAVTIEYSHGEAQSQAFPAPLRTDSGEIELRLGESLKPRSVKMVWNLLIEDYDHRVQEGELTTRLLDPYKTVHDDGAGSLVDDSGVVFGTVEYATGKIKFRPDTTVKIPKAKYEKIPMGERVVSTDRARGEQQVKALFRYAYQGIEYIDAAATMPIDESALVTVHYWGQHGERSAREVLGAGTLTLRLLPQFQERLLPNSVLFSLGGERYFDRRGEMYYRLQAETGAATRCGSIDYQTGEVQLEHWRGTYHLQLHSLASSIHEQPVDEVVFRTPASPLRPQSLTVSATPVRGGQIRVRADAHSRFSGENVEGYVIEEYGVARLRFGQKVTAAGHESQPWYKADEIDEAGKIWKPEPVFADSIRFSGVAYAYLPLDTSQIGIDAVRLPSDGLVPCFRKGDMLVLLDYQQENLGETHRAGQTVALSRANIDKLLVVDAKEQALAPELYQADLAAGTLRWHDALDLSAYTMPLSAKHAVIRNNRVVDLDISGEITLQMPLDRDFPRQQTVVANALIGGDLAVRATEPFSQQAWNKQWSDERSADAILAKLNTQDYPIELSSDGAIHQRWAIQFTSDSQFEVIGENLGLIAEGNILSDCAPLNPSTGQPYFTIKRRAFGSGWAARNLIRFNTYGTQIPVWLIRAVQPSAQRQQQADQVTVCLHGNSIDAS